LNDPAKINNFFHTAAANGSFFGLIFNFNQATFAGGMTARLGDWDERTTGMKNRSPSEAEGGDWAKITPDMVLQKKKRSSIGYNFITISN